jgi:hypothetical protein
MTFLNKVSFESPIASVLAYCCRASVCVLSRDVSPALGEKAYIVVEFELKFAANTLAFKSRGAGV